MGRIEVVLGPRAMPEQVAERIRRTFGIANFSRARRVALDLDVISSAILEDLRDHECGSFRVSVRRADKRFPQTSPQVEREIGGRIKAARGWRVDLEHGELVIHVELLSNDAFYFFGKERGPGGLPVGTAGRVACLLSGGIDSPVAAWRMMKRGCTSTFVHFHSYPSVSRVSGKGARAGDALTHWQQRRACISCRSERFSSRSCSRCWAHARRGLRVAYDADSRKHCPRAQAQALITGEVVGQVASQTSRIWPYWEGGPLPVFRPLVAWTRTRSPPSPDAWHLSHLDISDQILLHAVQRRAIL